MVKKRNQRTRSRRRRQQKRGKRTLRGGRGMVSPATFSNSSNFHYRGVNFTDPSTARAGCGGVGASNIYKIIANSTLK
jgi:hypothetical protein